MDQTVDLSQFRKQYSHYAQRLLSDLGLGDVRQPERGRLLAAIERYVQQVVLTTILENINQEGLERAEQQLEDGDGQEEALSRLITSIPDIDVIIANRLTDAYAGILKDARQLATAIAKLQPSANPQEN